MKGALIFLLASLAIFSTIEAQSRKIYGKFCKLRARGKTWTMYNAPDGCCNRRGYLIPETLTGSVPKCLIVCPALRALKGCEFMCRWPMCNRDTNGDYDQCKTKCETMPLPPVDEYGDGEIDCSIGLGLEFLS